MPPPDRSRALKERCAGDDSLREVVERLLSSEDQRTLAATPGPASTLPGTTTVPALPHSSTSGPERIGPYTILDLIGEGGMGAVYLAEQERPRRVVALKLIRPGLMTPRMLRRFEHESEILARLQHPGIAQIYEAGSAKTDFGVQPYFAMEYVRGTPLTAFADEHKLSIRQRLAMFVRICEAVHHAHQKGVIHRDLKPGNVLVQMAEGQSSLVGGGGGRITDIAQPKILDFGIARSTDGDLETRTMQTEAGQLVGTIPYMSPEQVSGDPNAIDTRSDVYTLGVMLYELLSGRLPHAVSDKTIPEAVRTISHSEPAPLGSLDRTLRGDIQTIVGKAMEKDRSRRYQSASDLAMDIQRLLRDEPILARPPSRVYLFRKFAARNRAVVVGSAAAVVLLIGGIAATSVQAVRAEHARARAREEADLARSANEFLTGMLAAANPEEGNDRELTVREMVDRAAELLERQEVTTTTNPRVAMSLHSTLSTTYRTLGRAAEAVSQAERAVSLAESIAGIDANETIEARRTLAIGLAELGKLEESERLTRDCLAALESRLGPHALETARARGELGRVLLESGDLTEAEPTLRTALEDLCTAEGERHPDAISALDHLGLTLQRLGRFDESEAIERKGLKIREEVFGPESLVVTYSLSNLANIAQRLGRHAEAAELLQRALDIRRKRLDPEHPGIQVAMTNLAVALVGLKRLDEAERLLNDGLAMQSRRLGEGHPKTLSTMGNLAFVQEDLGRLEDAEKTYQRLISLRRQGRLSEQTAWGDLNNYAMLLQRLGRPAEAEPIYRELLPLCDAGLPAGHYICAIFRNNFGDCLTDLRKFDEAEHELLRSQRELEAFFKPPHARIDKGRARLARLYEAWGKPERAAEYRATPRN
ncbi:MAG: serine/threonine protein kinase [Phycisphaerales bacterium]|nr:serine/threonine protein kinase [Phycisphaerales bacterium]